MNSKICPVDITYVFLLTFFWDTGIGPQNS